MIQRVLPTTLAGQEDLASTYQVAQIAIVALAVIAQTVWVRRPICVVGPLYFLSGLAMVLCGPLVGIFAIALSLGCALMLRRLSLVFIFIPVGLMAFGALFSELSIMTVIMASAFALPAFLSFALGKRILGAPAPRGGGAPAPR